MVNRLIFNGGSLFCITCCRSFSCWTCDFNNDEDDNDDDEKGDFGDLWIVSSNFGLETTFDASLETKANCDLIRVAVACFLLPEMMVIIKEEILLLLVDNMKFFFGKKEFVVLLVMLAIIINTVTIVCILVVVQIDCWFFVLVCRSSIHIVKTTIYLYCTYSSSLTHLISSLNQSVCHDLFFAPHQFGWSGTTDGKTIFQIFSRCWETRATHPFHNFLHTTTNLR